MVSYKLVYNRKNVLDAEGKALVQIEAYQQGKRRYFTTGVRIPPASWNAKNREVKNDMAANQRIRQRLADLHQFELTFPTTHGRSLLLADFDLLPTSLTEATTPVPSFSAYMLAEIEADKPGVMRDTYQKRLRVLNRLRDFQGRDTLFDDLTFAFISRLDQAMRGQFKLDDNTIEHEHRTLKRYVGRAVSCGMLTRNPYDQFKAKGKATNKIILTDEEIRRIETLPLDGDKQHLAIYRDAFLLGFYTMLRVSDLTTLTPKMVVEIASGLQLEKKQIKTRQLVRIPLGTLHGGKAQDLLRKYWPDSDSKPFFKRTHQHMNRRLKTILALAGIAKTPVGFHTARHSGITSLVRRGVGLPIVQRLAGHADIKMTMRYVHLAGADVEQALGTITNW
jgi:integrase